MMQVLEERFTGQPSSHWKKELDEKQLPADVIEKYDYPAADHIAEVNRYILNLDHPSHGAIQSLGFPIYMSESPARLRSMAPCTGQHSAEILQERLGYTDAEIEALATSGAIRS
jgi:crotonobetainyl-CoA:carnitine CoA-transferase CaiB-like acyl-CoA transferase